MRTFTHSLFSLLLIALIGTGCKSTETSTSMPDSASMPSIQPAPEEEPQVQMEANNASSTDNMASEILAKHIEARGGLDKIKAVKSMKWEGNLQTMGMQMPMTVYVKRPGMMRSEVIIPSMNAEVIQGYDGSIAWMINPMAGGAAMELPPDQTQAQADQANMDGLLIGSEEMGYTVEYEGLSSVRDMPTHKFKVVREGNSDVIVHLDADTFLETSMEAEGMNPQTGETVQTVTFFGEYKDVEGMPMAHSVKVEMGGQLSTEISLDEIKLNISINDQIFSKPE